MTTGGAAAPPTDVLCAAYSTFWRTRCLVLAAASSRDESHFAAWCAAEMSLHFAFCAAVRSLESMTPLTRLNSHSAASSAASRSQRATQQWP
jgi:hypothetical protein